MKTPRRPGPPIAAALASAALAIALYAVTLGGTYVYDDVAVVQHDPRVLSPGGWIDLLRLPYAPGTPDPLWRPLTSLTFWAQFHLHGATPWPFHVVNVLLHAAVSAIVVILAWQLTQRAAAAWWAGLLFAAHPVHVEAVAYLVGRAESVCALGVLGGVSLFLIRPLTPARAAGIFGCFVAAVLSKEHGILLPPMLLIAALANRWGGRPPLTTEERPPAKWLFVGLSFGTLAYSLCRESIAHLNWDTWFLRWTINPMVRAHGLDRALLPLSILGRYVAVLLLPLRPSPDYGANLTGYRLHWDDPYFYIGGATIIAAAVWAIVAVRRRWTTPLLLLACAALAYTLIGNAFMIIGIVMGERLIYLTSAFVIVLAAAALARLPARAALPIAIPIIALLSLRTATYAWRWNDPVRLFSLSRAEHPESIFLHVLESDALADRGALDAAERVAAAGRALQPESQNIWAVSARIAELRGDTAAAAEYGGHAFELANHPPQETDVKRSKMKEPQIHTDKHR